MAAKALLLLAVVAIIVSVAIVAAFWYFNQESERDHEKDLKQMEHTERVMDIAERETSIDRELSRERERDRDR